MDQVYEGAGVRFRYPSDWAIQEESGKEQTTIAVSDGATTLWSVTLLPARPPAEHVLRTAISAFCEEYPDVEVERSEQTVSRRTRLIADLEFDCLDLLNHVVLQTFRTGRFTVLLMAQATEHDRPMVDPILEAIGASLDCDLDADVKIR